jgi:pilus assembly protein Flp/PilA
MQTYFQKIMTFLRDEEGASAIEYALLVGLIAVAIVAAVTALGGMVATNYSKATTALGT